MKILTDEHFNFCSNKTFKNIYKYFLPEMQLQLLKWG